VRPVSGWTIVRLDQMFGQQIGVVMLRPFGSNVWATDGSSDASSMIVITAAKLEQIHVDGYVCNCLIRFCDQWMSNQNSSWLQKASPTVRHASSPKLANCLSRGMTYPTCISRLYNGFAIKL
jgi:hypothetical protein